MKNIQIILIQNVQAIQKPIVKKGGNNLCDKKYKLESNIKKEYEKLKRRMKYPVHYVRHIIANIGPFGMIICTTGLWSLSEKGLTDHSWIVLAFIIGEVIGMIITIYNIGYVGEY